MIIVMAAGMKSKSSYFKPFYTFPLKGIFKYLNIITFYNIIWRYIMVSITLSVPEGIKKKMDSFQEMNWSGFIRESIIEKTKELSWKEDMLKKIEQEEKLTDWSIESQRKVREGRFLALKKKGLV